MDESSQSTSVEIRNDEEQEAASTVVVPWTHPNHIFQRLLALFLMCLIGFGKNLYPVYNIMY